MSKKPTPTKSHLLSNKKQFVILLDTLKAMFENHASQANTQKRRYKIQQMERKKKINQTKSWSSNYGPER